MSNLILKLTEYGADINGAMSRFLNDTTLYETCYDTFVNDEAFNGLGEAIATKDFTRAFEFAHSLKGITGNMGITPLYKIICELVEELRHNDLEKVNEHYNNIINELEKLKSFIE
ncbi:MAG: Hpt domain-containing protein [Clostridia bacterium]